MRAIIKGIHLTPKRRHATAMEGKQRPASAMEGMAFALDKHPEVEVSGLKVSSATRTYGGKIKATWDDANFKVLFPRSLNYFRGHVWEAVTQDEMRRYKDWKLV